MQRVFACLQADARGLRGRLVGWVGNRQALAQEERFLDQDLNRVWTEERIEGARRRLDPQVREERELLDLANRVDRELEACPEARVLDLHSTSGEGPAFTTVDDTLANRSLAFSLPVTHVLGLEEELAATMVGYLNQRGVTAIGFESGQHLDPASVDRAEAAVWIAMETSGVLQAGTRREVEDGRRLLERSTHGGPGVVEIRQRHALRPGDEFTMEPGFRSFQRIRKGQLLARDASGPILCDQDGMILMPLYQDQGDDGFFVIRRVNRIWLRVSAWVRRLRMDRFVHWLPGVRRHPELPGVFEVDRTRARWLALQVFHLLGFRRRSVAGTLLEMARREEL